MIFQLLSLNDANKYQSRIQSNTRDQKTKANSGKGFLTNFLDVEKRKSLAVKM